jgi:hypothetical protein
MSAFAVWLAGVLLVVLIWFFFRSGGYKRRALGVPPGPDWVKTDERFVDPSSGETLDVWFHPDSGERAYVRARPGGDERHQA